jgi:acid phosphatase family membrane protein YuiD
MGELLSNQVLWTAILASVLAQLLKLIIYYLVAVSYTHLTLPTTPYV